MSVHLPAVTAGLGGDGMTVGVDPASLGDVPPSPGDAGSGAEPAAAARGEPGADLDARTAPARRPGPAGAAPIGAATARPAPAPISPPGAPLTSFALALVGLATGAEVTSRRTGAPHAGVLGAARALRNRLLLGVLRNVVPGGSPPGFAVLLARPG